MRMGSARRLSTLVSALACLAATDAVARPPRDGGPTQMTLIKGDTHEGFKILLRIDGDSAHYHRTEYRPSESARETRVSIQINGARRGAFKRVLGTLPHYRTFGSCWGKEMRFYLVESPGGKFYRSLPERSGRCYTDEPGIFSVFDDLETLLEPPMDEGLEELSGTAKTRTAAS